MNNLYEAYASNPRYAEGGLEAEIDREELATARQKDAQAASVAELEAIAPTPEPVETPEPAEGEQIEPDNRKSALDMHEKILQVVDTASGGFRDVTGGMHKATGNTLALIVGRENMDKGNEWLRENLPGLTEMTDQMERGLEPRGTVSAVTQEMSQFMIPFGLYMKGLGGLAAANNVAAGTLTKSIIADVVTSGSAMNPHMERFSAMMKTLGVDNRINDWLADNENETESEGRLKNILDSVGAATLIGTGFLAAALTLKGLWRAGKFIKAAEITKAGPVSGSPKSQLGAVGDLSKTSDEFGLIQAKSSDYGKNFETGKSVTFNYVHNKESATKIHGKPKKDSPYGRWYEPSGKYVTAVKDAKKPDFGDFDTGAITFKNPLVIENDNLGWKESLSKKYGGKRGAALSKAIIKDGHDGVVTVDNGHASEILDLTTFDPNRGKPAARKASPRKSPNKK